MSNYNFAFHETFQPQIIYLSEILKLASIKFAGTKEDISNQTGIPTGATSGKVMPHVKYMDCMGFINYKEKLSIISLSLTKLGEVVYNNDPYLMEDLTKILMHYNLTSKNGAPQWRYVFRELEYALENDISLKNINSSGISIYGKDIKIGPLKSMYTDGDFEDLSIIEISKDNLIFKEKYDSFEMITLYGYVLLKEWENVLSDKNEIIVDEIFDEIKWNKGFNFSYDTAIDVLDELSLRGFIKLNKQFNPITIIKNCDSESLLERLYEDLI